MSEISEDGFWQMVDGEWIPTEKQLEAIQNGAIGHDGKTVQQEIGEPESPESFTHQLEIASSESQFTGTEEYVAFVGYTLIGIGVLDFLLSITGTNITFFLGFFSYFTPILFGAAGGALISAKEEFKWFKIDRFSESNSAKGIYAGTVVMALVLVGILGAMSNYSNEEIVGTWHNPVQTFTFNSDGTLDDSMGEWNEWRVDGSFLFLVDPSEPEYEYMFKYTISNEMMFLAPIDDDDSVMKDSCSAYAIKGVNWDDAEYTSWPSWCGTE